ncbi:MAG: MBL fold metallo-hydrolase [Oscillospiraceae bacterium]|nr:MBL fold metallo-hydrolase [Oscillospiraceae bacterium]
MQKIKLYTLLCLCIVSVTVIVFAGGCSAQSGGIDDINTTNTTDNFLESTIPSMTSGTEVTDSTEASSAETSETTETEYAIDTDTEYGIMEIYVFAIGKADAILITTENHTVMIDTGETKDGLRIVEYLRNRDITEIDDLIITHFHKDHVGGASAIIQNLDVKEVIVPNYGKQSKQYDRFIAAMNEAGLELNILTETMEFTLDNSVFTVYPPQLAYYDYSGDNANDEDNDVENGITPNENDFSIVVSVKHGNNNFLFTGDAMGERLGELLLDENIMNTQYDYLKVPYHGRYNEGCIKFINAIKPKYAVMTCSSDPTDGSGDDRVVSALEEAGVGVYLTKNGDVYCVSNGETLMMSYK